MPTYCVNRNAQPNGDHEVHDIASTKGCLPEPVHRINLGWHPSCREAVREAKNSYFRQSNGCYYCARECNTG